LSHEGLIHLEEVEVLDRHASAFEESRRRLHRPIEVIERLGADETLRHDAGPGAQPECVGPRLIHEQDGGGAVRYLG
jgi:hypothetical protein